MRKHLARARIRSIGALLGVAALGATLAATADGPSKTRGFDDSAQAAVAMLDRKRAA